MLEIRDLHKRFDDADVLRGVSLTIETGEFVTLLGPSGCGKTTTLRIVAGLTAPDGGRVLLDGADITALPPEKRDVNTVFQSYALFPHMNVGRNIAYGLRVRGVKKDERERRVQEMLRLVALEGFEGRMPSQLSGGQRQRIAIARALVLKPRLLLLDEPLGALDLKLRQQMQRELKDIQKRSGIAFLYVTHDQEEALNLSDRIAIMRDGLIEQIGAPEDIYERPQTRFAAEFIGQSNFLPCEVVDTGSGVPVLSCAGQRFPGRAVDFKGVRTRVALRGRVGDKAAEQVADQIHAVGDGELNAHARHQLRQAQHHGARRKRGEQVAAVEAEVRGQVDPVVVRHAAHAERQPRGVELGVEAGGVVNVLAGVQLGHQAQHAGIGDAGEQDDVQAGHVEHCLIVDVQDRVVDGEPVDRALLGERGCRQNGEHRHGDEQGK